MEKVSVSRFGFAGLPLGSGREPTWLFRPSALPLRVRTGRTCDQPDPRREINRETSCVNFVTDWSPVISTVKRLASANVCDAAKQFRPGHTALDDEFVRFSKPTTNHTPPPTPPPPPHPQPHRRGSQTRRPEPNNDLTSVVLPDQDPNRPTHDRPSPQACGRSLNTTHRWARRKAPGWNFVGTGRFDHWKATFRR